MAWWCREAGGCIRTTRSVKLSALLWGTDTILFLSGAGGMSLLDGILDIEILEPNCCQKVLGYSLCFHGVEKHIKPEVEQPHHPLVEVGVGAGVLPDQLVLVDSERHQLKSCLDVAFPAISKQPTAPQ